MRIVSISDTHGYHRRIDDLPEADTIIHCGDISRRGEISIIKDFALWFSSLPYTNKIFIAGNHDLTLERSNKIKKELLEHFKSLNLIYLENSAVNIDGVNFYGSPHTPLFHNWAFNVPRGTKIAQKWGAIPDDTNVLITHGPPEKILDIVPRWYGAEEHTGCADLLERVFELKKLRAHLFGHIHEGYGFHEEYGIKFVNSSVCNGKYEPVNKPQVIDIKI